MSKFTRDDSVDHMRSLVGTVVDGRFELLSALGEGGSGLVLRARQLDLARDVALKFMSRLDIRDETKRTRFLREAKILAGLSHPNIVKIFAIGEFQGQPYIAMEAIDGTSLNKVIEQSQLSVPECIQLSKQIAEGLAAAHQLGIVHRDIKPSNIMLTGDSPRKAVIIDFGTGKLQQDGQKLTVTDALLGTPMYMSPEQFRGGKADERADIYSLGCLMYEMLSGKPPFTSGSLYEIAMAQSQATPPPLPEGIPAWLKKLIFGMMAKQPADRPQSAAQVAQALDEQRWNGIQPWQLKKDSLSKMQLAVAAIISVMVALVLFNPFSEHHRTAGSNRNYEAKKQQLMAKLSSEKKTPEAAHQTASALLSLMLKNNDTDVASFTLACDKLDESASEANLKTAPEDLELVKSAYKYVHHLTEKESVFTRLRIRQAHILMRSGKQDEAVDVLRSLDPGNLNDADRWLLHLLFPTNITDKTPQLDGAQRSPALLKPLESPN